MTPEQIERAKAQGAQKRKERAEKRAKKLVENKEVQHIELQLPEDLLERLHKACNLLERSFLQKKPLKQSDREEIKQLFTLNSREERLEAYKRHQLEYEDIIFYSWGFGWLGKAAFNFFDEVLEVPENSCTPNSLLRIIGCSVNYRLLKLVEHHRDKVLREPQFMIDIYRSLIDKKITGQPAPWEEPLTSRQVEILKKVRELL